MLNTISMIIERKYLHKRNEKKIKLFHYQKIINYAKKKAKVNKKRKNCRTYRKQMAILQKSVLPYQ